MRVLILGGTAFMGPFIVRKLLSLGHGVAIFHRGKTTAELPAGVTVIRGDRHQLGNHVAELRAYAPDVVVDMIAFNRHDAKDLVEVFGGVAKRAVVASSADVYRQFGGLIGVEQPPVENGPLGESAPLRTKHYPFRAQAPHRSDMMYSYDKLDVEEVLRGSALPSTILRLPMVYGEGDRQRRLSPYLKKLEAGEKVIALGQTHAAWKTARGYAGNMAQAVVLAALNEAGAGKTYNVADQVTLAEAEFAAAVIRAGGYDATVKVVPDNDVPPKDRHPGDPSYHLDLNTTKFRQELGYSDEVPQDEALARTVKWELATLK